MRISIIFLMFGFFLISTSANAQQRFRAGLIAGLTASQINGDVSAGYNKLGLRGGLRAITVLGEKTELSFDILFSQRGSLEKDPIRSTIHLNYVEVPVLYTYKDWLDEEGGGYYRVSASAGLAYGRLINSSIENFGIIGDVISEQENFSENDVSVVFGVSYYTGPKFGFSVYYTRSLNPLYNNKKHQGLQYTLTGYFLAFQAAYIF